MFKIGEIVVAGSKYDQKFLYEGVRCEIIELKGKKVKILEGPGKGRRVMADFSKLEKYDGVFVPEEEKLPKFKTGRIVTILSKDQFSILEGKHDYPKYTFHGDSTAHIFGCSATVIDNNMDFNEEDGFTIEVEIQNGEWEGSNVMLLESEIQEFYEKKKKFRLSFLDEEGVHHTKEIEAGSLEDARKKVGPIKQEYYHMSL